MCAALSFELAGVIIKLMTLSWIECVCMFACNGWQFLPGWAVPFPQVSFSDCADIILEIIRTWFMTAKWTIPSQGEATLALCQILGFGIRYVMLNDLYFHRSWNLNTCMQLKRIRQSYMCISCCIRYGCLCDENATAQRHALKIIACCDHACCRSTSLKLGVSTKDLFWILIWRL